ncbi:hypothetical protein PVT71_07860 [Salipiger sp. H15]|uniref:DUF4375 domain-containing protein n=1 Tax=Alloyangia sp. H15 TaxID=3029062 RepID=A0AAU8ADW0_9RHOB
MNFNQFANLLPRIGDGAHHGRGPFWSDWLDGLDPHRFQLNLRGIDFVDADAEGAETTRNIDAFLQKALEQTDAGTLASLLTVDGSKEKAFLVIWEYLDDGYVGEGYYAPVNENFIRLGVEYASYLAEGGASLTDAIAKFTPDDGDANDTPERLQSVHDNLLGNLSLSAIESRFGAGTAEAIALIALVEEVNPDLLERPYYSGNEGAGAAHDAVRAFDYDQGYARSDYIETHFGAVDARATEGGLGTEMIFGDGNSADGYAVTRHEGAGVELALKVKLRGVGDYDDSHVSYAEDGSATFTVEAGPASTDRMAWNVDWAATVTEAGDDDSFEFRLLLDVDGSEAEQFVDLAAATGNEYGTAPSLQNSWNYGFFDDALFDTTEAEGHYTVRLEAWDDGALIASQTIYIDAV